MLAAVLEKAVVQEKGRARSAVKIWFGGWRMRSLEGPLRRNRRFCPSRRLTKSFVLRLLKALRTFFNFVLDIQIRFGMGRSRQRKIQPATQNEYENRQRNALRGSAPVAER